MLSNAEPPFATLKFISYWAPFAQKSTDNFDTLYLSEFAFCLCWLNWVKSMKSSKIMITLKCHFVYFTSICLLFACRFGYCQPLCPLSFYYLVCICVCECVFLQIEAMHNRTAIEWLRMNVFFRLCVCTQDIGSSMQHI